MTNSEKTIREIALEAPESVRVFEEFSIDYCCGGAKTLSEACLDADAAPEAVQEKLDAVLSGVSEPAHKIAPENKSATDLINYILDKHHTFARIELERMTALMEKVSVKHGDKHPELHSLRERFEQLRADLLPHMQKEEGILFPFIQRLDSEPVKPEAPFGTVQNPIRMMMLEHETAGGILKEIRSLTSDFDAPADACPSYNALYFGLGELERDLHRHIHLENNVLFPMAVELEQD